MAAILPVPVTSSVPVLGSDCSMVGSHCQRAAEWSGGRATGGGTGICALGRSQGGSTSRSFEGALPPPVAGFLGQDCS